MGDFFSSPEFIAGMSAFGLSFIMVGAGLLTAKIAFHKALANFIKTIIASMVLRLFLTIGLVYVMLAIVKLSILSFTLTFLISYFVFLMAEVFYINYSYNTLMKHRRVSLKTAAKNYKL